MNLTITQIYGTNMCMENTVLDCPPEVVTEEVKIPQNTAEFSAKIAENAEKIIQEVEFEAIEGQKPLKRRQKLFALAFIKTKCATTAAKIAGYSAHSAGFQGNKLLKVPQIRAIVDKAFEQERAMLTREQFVARAMRFETDKSIAPGTRIRGLEVAGQALGHIGGGPKVQVNVDSRSINIEVGNIDTLAAPQKWDKIRALLGQ